ncbi:MAG: acyl-CoA dehydrogenase C-terminal domain-containing protein [Wenzhouxiangella sp.]|jgi:alkylation response protein AidB-like acyl-CoA dehydrogenase|nr:acyl-CoA dehydrogenase C-terminal domain-containing protein [Wenzhouxiangella sp.]
MPTFKAPLEDFRFLYNEFLDLDALSDLPTMAEVSPDLIESILDEAAKVTQEVLQPLNEVGDRIGCRYDGSDHSVTMPAGFKEAYRQFCEAGWSGLVADPDYGGQGLPSFIGLAVSEMKNAANPSFAAYPGLTLGAYEVIHAYGSDEQKQTYLPNMISGEWTGTMNLTEPQCGTDLGLIRTRAEPNDDGSYAITGTKIWITAGEHDMADSIIHLVLARTPDAPEGTRGISLFLVPKVLVNEDGSLGERNGVFCSSIEKKMGIKASATCEMTYEGATGYLIGEENRGLAAMFTMMNAARLVTGIQGLGMAEAAYQAAVTFARERLQGRSLDGAKSPDKPADPIIVHPDVRRMLLISRAYVEGARALGIYTGVQLETERHHPDPEARRKAGYWVELMTPIIKAFFTDIGFEVTNLGMQVHGGAGYVTDTGVEQFARDVRITQIYEGTNGVQALDLVGRKLVANNGENLKAFFEPVQAFLAEHSANEDLSEFVKPLADAAQALQDTTAWLYQQMASNPIEAGAASSDYLRLFALTATAFMWARMAVIAKARLNDGETRGGFYQAKLDTARFFMTRMLPDRLGLEAKIKAGSMPMMALADEAF